MIYYASEFHNPNNSTTNIGKLVYFFKIFALLHICKRLFGRLFTFPLAVIFVRVYIKTNIQQKDEQMLIGHLSSNFIMCIFMFINE